MTLAKEMFLREQIALEKILSEAMNFQLELVENETFDEDYDFLFEEDNEVKEDDQEKKKNIFKRFVEWIKTTVSKLVITVKNFFTRRTQAYKEDQKNGVVYKSKYDVKKAFSAITSMHKNVQKFCAKFKLDKDPKDVAEFIDEAQKVYVKLNNKENFDLEKYLIQSEASRITTAEFKNILDSLKKDSESAIQSATWSKNSAEMRLKRLEEVSSNPKNENIAVEYKAADNTQKLSSWQITLITKIVSATNSLINSIVAEKVEEKEDKAKENEVKKEDLESIYGEAITEKILDEAVARVKGRAGGPDLALNIKNIPEDLKETRRSYARMYERDSKRADKESFRVVKQHARQFASIREQCEDMIKAKPDMETYLKVLSYMHKSLQTFAKSFGVAAGANFGMVGALSAGIYTYIQKRNKTQEYYPMIKKYCGEFIKLLREYENKYNDLLKKFDEKAFDEEFAFLFNED